MMRSAKRREFGLGSIILCGALFVAANATAGSDPAEKKEPAEKPQSSEGAKTPAEKPQSSEGAKTSAEKPQGSENAKTPPAREAGDRAAQPAQSPYVAAARAARERREAHESEAVVITNDNLGAAVGEIPANPVASTDESPSPAAAQVPARSATEWMQQREADAAARRQAVAEAEASVQAARQRVADLEQQILAIKNPFSARPKLSDDEKTARQADGSTSERLQRTQAQLDEARQTLAEAEDRLARTRRQG